MKMLISHNFIAIAAVTVLITLSIFLLSRIVDWLTCWPLRLLSALFVSILVLYLPVYRGCTLVQIIHGVIGDLSVTTFVILSGMLIRNIFIPKRSFNLPPFFAVMVMFLGSMLYLSTLGFIDLDIYSFGYFPKGTMLFIIGVLELFLLGYASCYAWLWVIALICFYFKLENSNNLWDYLFDPLLWLMVAISLFRRQNNNVEYKRVL